MAEDLIARYQLDISDLKLQVKELTGQYQKLDSEQKKTAKSGEDGFKKTGAAAKETSDATKFLEDKIKSIGTTIAAAFAVERIIAFGKQCVLAFGEAERNALKLKTAVGVNGGVADDFDRLISQSERFQKKSIFSDDQIQSVQTAALQFGLTAEQVENLTPVLIDFASATGQDLNSALSVVIAGTNGATRGLKQYGITIDENASAQDRYNAILDQANQKFAGQGELIASQTTLGAIEKTKNAWDDFTESIGKFIATKTNLAEYLSVLAQIIGNGFDVQLARIGKKTEEQLGVGSSTINKWKEQFKKQIDEAGGESTAKTEEIIKSLDKTIERTQGNVSKLTNDLKGQSEEQQLLTEDNIATQNALVIGYKELQTELRRYNQSRINGDVNYSKLSTDKLKELSNQNNVFATKELERRKDAADKAAQAGAKSADKQKESLESLIKFTEEIENKGVELNAKSNEIKIQNDREAALKRARDLFEGAGGSASKKAVEELNKAEYAINKYYIDLIKEDRVKSIRTSFDEQKKIFDEQSKEQSQAELDQIEIATNQKTLALKQAYLQTGDFSKQAEKKLQDDITKIQLDAEKQRIELKKKQREQSIQDEYNAEVNAAFQKALIENDGNTLRAASSKTYLDAVTAANEKANKSKGKSDAEYAKDKTQLDLKVTDEGITNTNVETENWIQKNSEKIAAAQNASAEILNLFTSIVDAQVKAKEEELTLLQQSYDNEDAELQKRFEQRLIGAADFEKQQAALKQRRVDDEKKIQEELKKLKRQEDIANRARSIFDIIINTSVAVSKLLATPFLAIAAGIAGAAQLSAVLATPLPKYAKGTKWLKRGNNPYGVDTIPIMADEGERIIPRDRNKKYWSIYEAIDDNRFESLIQQKYIAPALKRQLKEFNNDNAYSLAQNISNSLMMNHNELASKIGSEIEWRNRNGIKVKGMDELIGALTKTQDIRKR